MRIGVPREIKKDENRIGLTPTSVREITNFGHEVVVEKDAGLNIGLFDEDYESAGATISTSVRSICCRHDRQGERTSNDRSRTATTWTSLIHILASRTRA